MSRDEIRELIWSECAKGHGRGKLFPRADALGRDPQAAEKRRRYAAQRPELAPERRDAILAGAITPGMTRDEVAAAWNLAESPHTGAVRKVEYMGRLCESWSGFDVGRRYTLFLQDGILAGVLEE